MKIIFLYNLKRKREIFKCFKGYKDNHQIVKLIYLHEGYEGEGKHKKLNQINYFGALYTGKEKEKRWKKVKDAIERIYDTEELEKIYFQSDGGSWMKKGVEMLGTKFVLDGFQKVCKKFGTRTERRGKRKGYQELSGKGRTKKAGRMGKAKCEGNGREKKETCRRKLELHPEKLERDT